MALLTTGLIKNTEVCGVRPNSTLTVRLYNPDQISVTIRISGCYWSRTTKTDYVLDILTLAPREVRNIDYFAQLEALEFQFITSSDTVEIAVWGKNAAGKRTVVHSVLPGELLAKGMKETAGEQEMTIPSNNNQIYVLNSNNTISVIDGNTNSFIGNVIVGSGPYGIGVNSVTDRIYVANFGGSNVSVLDGKSNAVLTTITVGINPVGVGVNPATNRIYVTNWGGHSLSVIDGFTHVVIATIPVGESPEGVNVNPVTNRIYTTNHGSNDVSVIDGKTNSVIATVRILL